MTDTFERDIANSYDLPQIEEFVLGDGSRYWPSLIAASLDGYRPLTLDLTVPVGKGPFPLVVWIHGGGWMIGHPKVTNPVILSLDPFGRLVGAGYAVARISYRLAREAAFPAALHDVKASLRYLRAKAGDFALDPQRFAVMGESAGGYLALMAGLCGADAALEGAVGITGVSSAVSAVVNWYGATDLGSIDEQVVAATGAPRRQGAGPADLFLGYRVAENPARATADSPVAHVHAGAPPVLTQHGTADRWVPLAQAEALQAAMTRSGADHRLQAIEGADHCFWNGADAMIMDEVLAFLGEVL